MDRITVGIEASNLNYGGGRTHLINILSNFQIENHNIRKIVIWASDSLLASIGDYPWLEKRTNSYINGNLIQRHFWLLFKSQQEFRKYCDILFAPGGLYFGHSIPFVSMSRNMLLFDRAQKNRQSLKLRLKLTLSGYLHRLSLKRAVGVIFLSDYAYETIMNELNIDEKRCIKIPHGISSQFIIPPEDRDDYQANKRFELLYVSHIYHYKHPWNVVEAVRVLNEKGRSVGLKIIGGGDSSSIKKLKNSIKSNDPHNSFIEYLGLLSHENIHQYYRSADAFVYASTCENMPNILIEAMSSSLPIACSDSAPMPEFLEDGGVYFRSLDIPTIVNAIEKLISSQELRKELGRSAFILSRKYSWYKTAQSTFNFIELIHKQNVEK